jgi:PIN domain nuclease of toxin-antitoxin system
MRLLLDTHALLWWWLDDPRLSRRASEAIGRGHAEVYVSAATAWEIATKVRLGKLPAARRLAEEFEAGLAEEGFHELPITVAHGTRAGLLKGDHGDPFDRMLAAQSMIEGLPVVSADARIGRLGAELLW